MKRFFAIAYALLGCTAPLFAQTIANASVSSSIITPITISKTADLNFGNVAVSSTLSGTVLLTPGGTRTATAGVTIPVSPGTVSSAAFTVAGEAGYSYSISLPATPVIITNGSNTMSITFFTAIPSSSGTLTGGTQTLTVGATLNVGAGQQPGTYVSSTTFDITVNYN